MQKKIKYDLLDFQKKKTLVNNEEVYLSLNLTKYNDLGFRQERTFVVTVGAIYNIRKSSVQRRIPLEKLEALSVSTLSSEFVLHVRDGYDYRMSSFEHRNAILRTLAYMLIEVRKLASMFPVYEVSTVNLNKIMTTNAHFKKKQLIRPSKKCLKHFSLETLGLKEKEEEERVTKVRKNTKMLFNPGKKELCIEDFDQLKILGQGAFGKECKMESVV